MSKILIDNYRGFDIEFETINEKFQCIITDELVKESISFSAVKKFIDDYKKTNQEFKPFFVETIPSMYKAHTTVKVIGIRKDGRFICENSKGIKFQISDYDLKDYIVCKQENEPIIIDLIAFDLEVKKRDIELNEIRKNMLSKINIITLQDFKNTLI